MGVSRRIITFAFAASLSLLVPAKAADAESKSLSLGEVAVLPSSAAHMSAALRSALESEIRDLDLRATRKDAILSASLVKLDAEQGHGVVGSATCVVSVTLRSRTGVLFAVLEGRAQAQGSSDHVPESAMRGAVHGALTRVPEALR
jgi:hypothetical protein